MNRSAIAIALLAGTASAHAQVSVKYDRFKDRTEVSAAKPGVTLEGFNITWGARFPGSELTSQPPAEFVVMTSSKEWQYLRCNDTAFLVDGKPVETGKPKHDGQVQRGYVIEMVQVPVPAATLALMAAGQTIEMRLCRTEYKFDASDLANVRDFAAAIKPSGAK